MSQNNDFSCTFEEFKKSAQTFFQALPTCTADEAENGHKMLGIYYLNLPQDMTDLQINEAGIIYKIACDRLFERQLMLSISSPYRSQDTSMQTGTGIG